MRTVTTIDWGDGSPLADGIVEELEGSGAVTGEHTYGDNGAYDVSIEVCNDAEVCQQAVFKIAVNNQSPMVVIDIQGAIEFSGGLAHTGMHGIPQSHEATAMDPGSDDLIFAWALDGALVSTSLYYNDGVSEDPNSSPQGAFPFSVTDSLEMDLDVGKHTISLKVDDDDGGSAAVAIQKLVTDDNLCTRSMGFWRHQLRGKGKQHIDDLTLKNYLDIVNFSSGYFSEERPVMTLEEARDALNPSGSGMLHKAEAQLLSAWLNFASGSVNWGQLIPIEDEDGNIVELPFHDLVVQAETLLLDPESTELEYELAKDYAEAINLLDEGSAGCELDFVDGSNDEAQSDVESEDDKKESKK